MRVSANEIETGARKAAQGCGYAYGLAVEAAFATGWLCRRDLDGVGILLTCLKSAGRPKHGQRQDWLRQVTAHGWHWQPAAGASGGLDPLRIGPALADLLEAAAKTPAKAPTASLPAAVRLESCHAPSLLLGFVARAAGRAGLDISLSWPGARIVWRGDALIVPPAACSPHALILREPVTVDCAITRHGEDAASGTSTVSAPPPAPANQGQGIGYRVALRDWRRLMRLAARTMVESTAQSRLAGAGAGLVEND